MTTFFFGASMAVVEALGVEAQRAWHMATWWEALAILGVVLLIFVVCLFLAGNDDYYYYYDYDLGLS